MRQPELILFAKQPIAGLVKTRLLPEYGAERAAEIAAYMIRATVELAVSAWPGEISLPVWPDTAHPLSQELACEFHIRLPPQTGGDLGARMLNALREGVERHGSAAVMGCDVPHCAWDVLDQANDWLARGKNILGPTEDGGYYLIGMQEAIPELFENMPWGSHQVLSMTLARAEAIGIEFELMTKLRDI
jgi:uncharacterized protein